MIVSRRERILFVITLAVMLVIISDRFVFTPTVREWTNINNNITKLENERLHAEELFKRETAFKELWAKLDKDLFQSDSKNTIPDFLNHLKKLAESSGISLTDIYPIPAESKDEFTQAIFELKFQSNVAQLNKFMYALITSSECLYVSKIGISSNTGRTQRLPLEIDMRVSTLIAGEINVK